MLPSVCPIEGGSVSTPDIDTGAPTSSQGCAATIAALSVAHASSHCAVFALASSGVRPVVEKAIPALL